MKAEKGLKGSERNYYKRFRVYLRQKNYKKALRDIEKAVDINPKFKQGLVQRSRVLTTLGRCADAAVSYRAVLALDPTEKTAVREIPRVEKCDAEQSAAREMFTVGDFAGASAKLGSVFEVVTGSAELYLLRAQCMVELGQHFEALAETGKALKIEKKSLEALLLRGRTYYVLAEHDMALRHYREGLKYDPEHKPIKTAYRVVKKIDKLFSRGEQELIQDKVVEALADFSAAAQVDPAHTAFNKKAYMRQCHCHVHLKNWAGAHAACDAALAIDNDFVDAVTLKAKAYDGAEEYEESMRTWQRAHELNQEDGSIREGFQRAQAALKQSKEKNYYKILGVPRDADARMIKKAYRALALKYHPDKQKTEEEKEEAKVKFQDIGEANEVLSSEELRPKYDRGEDVFQNQGGGGGGQRHGFPFQHFQQQQQQGGQQFHFSFGG